MQVNGMKYQPPCALVVGKREDLVFGKVENVYVDVKTVFIEMITHCFSNHYHISLPPVSVRHRHLIKQQDLTDSSVWSVYISARIQC